MFVSVKAVKDNLDFLSKCNNDVYNKINDLTKEAKDIKEKYGVFLGSVEKFLLKMNADARIWDISTMQQQLTNNPKVEKTATEKKRRKGEKTTGKGEETEKADARQKTKEDGDSLCKKCKNKDEKFVGKVGKAGCLGCFLSNFKQRSFSRLPVLSEALLGSFLASLFWMQRDRDSGSTSSTSPGKDHNGKRSHEWLNLRDSTIRMICDVCEVVEGATRGEKEKQTEDEETDLSVGPSEESAMQRSLTKSANEVSCLFRGQKELKETKSEESRKWKREGGMGSEEESDLEEAGTKPLVSSQHFDLKAKPSLMCVGDMKKATQKTKSVVSSALDALPSWIEKLSTDIISKLMKRKSKASVRIFNHAYDKSKTGLRNLPGRLEFSVAANTPVGVFDVTVVQHKSRRLLRDRLMRPSSSLVQAVCTSGLKQNNQVSAGPTDPREDIYSWSEDSWQNIDSDTVSNSGESDLEEFIEIFVENPTKTRQKPTRTPTISSELKEITYKTSKSNCFQIQKCYPVHFIQEILQKTFTTKTVEVQEKDKSFRVHISPKTSTVDSQPKNDSTRQITTTSEEKNQEEMVLEGTPSDLVIYIQVEMEGETGPKTNAIFLKHQTSSLGTQTPGKEEKEQEDISKTPKTVTTTTTTERDKTIKLKEEIHEGVSLFQIWEGHGKDLQEEVYDREEEEEKKVEEDEEDLQEEVYYLEEEERKVQQNDVKEEICSREKIQEDEEEEEEMQEDEKVKDFQEEIIRWDKKIQKDTDKETKVKERKEKMVTFDEKLSEIIEGKLCPDKDEEDEIKMADAIGIDLRDAKKRVDIWLLQPNLHRVQRGEVKWVQHPQILETALKLIREIETDIVGVKLSDAISMLPRLESELRKHLQQKMKDMGEKEDSSLHNFFSAMDFWPEEEKEETESETSEDRLNNLLAMLSELEEAVKTTEHSDDRLTQENSSKIYKLLQALTASIRELEGRPSVTSLSQTLEIASQLDTAVREYDSIMRRQPVEYVWSGGKAGRRRWKERKSEDGVSVMQHLKNVRKKVFEIVEEEAIVAEGRLEMDFDRLDRLEGENDEALMFLETFLQKTERRVVELTDLKSELTELSSLLNALYESVKDRKTGTKQKAQIVETEKSEAVQTEQPEVVITIEQEVVRTIEEVVKTIDPEVASIAGPEEVNTTQPEVVETKQPEVVETKQPEVVVTKEPEVVGTKQPEVVETKQPEVVHIKAPEERNIPSDSSAESMTVPLPVQAQGRTEPLRETISGLLIALDTLKSKAREKKELCREILNSGTLDKVHESENSSQRSSRSSFTTKHTETLYTTVKEFKRIGETSLYLAWTRPEGPLKDSIVGFQIHVNGKLNQKVRNPQRRQAVLYSVDLTTNVNVQLFALTEKGQRIQLGAVTYQDQECLL